MSSYISQYRLISPDVASGIIQYFGEFNHGDIGPFSLEADLIKYGKFGVLMKALRQKNVT